MDGESGELMTRYLPVDPSDGDVASGTLVTVHRR